METDHETTDHETSLRRVRRVAAALLAAAGLTADAAPQIDIRFDDARGGVAQAHCRGHGHEPRYHR